MQNSQTMAKEKIEKLINKIAEEIDSGMTCFINPKTLEMVIVPGDMLDGGSFFGDTGIFDEDLEKIDTEWERFTRVDPLDSHTGFSIMERFIDEIDEDEVMANKLVNALNRPKPFRNFKNIVEISEYRQKWFDFKHQATEEYVKKELRELNE